MFGVETTTLLASLASGLFGGGIVFGAQRQRINQIEKELDTLEDVNERVARIEGKIDMLISLNTLQPCSPPVPPNVPVQGVANGR